MQPKNCENCKYLVDVFGNYVQCVKTSRFVTYEYWHNELPDDCPLAKSGVEEVTDK